MPALTILLFYLYVIPPCFVMVICLLVQHTLLSLLLLKTDVSDSANYRPIALVTIFSKILEHIIVARIERCFVGIHN